MNILSLYAPSLSFYTTFVKWPPAESDHLRAVPEVVTLARLDCNIIGMVSFITFKIADILKISKKYILFFKEYNDYTE